MKKLMVVDLMNLAFRAYYGFAKEAYLSTDGKPTFMCYGIALGLNRLLRDYQPDYMVIAADGGGKTFRHEMYSDYKSNRKPPPDDFKAQIDGMYEMLAAYGFKVAKVPQVEADDLIGTVATKFASDDLQVQIVSGDKDFMQLVNKNVLIVRHAAEGYTLMGADAVFDKFGVRPDQVVDALAIIGDAADVIPGVKGIGEVGAAALLNAFDTLEGVYANLGSIKTGMANKLAKSQDNAFLSKKLAKIDCAVPMDLDLESYRVPVEGLKRPELTEFYTKIGFKSLIQVADVGNEIPDKFLTTFGDLT